jgi:hypothetical protein
MMKKLPTWTLLLTLVLIPLFQARADDKMKTPWSITYSDGSANGYRFNQDTPDGQTRFEYSPVRPENSSTGIYSGGEPKAGTLDSKQSAELQKWVGKLESDKSIRTTERAKGSGAFTVRSGDKSSEFIIQQSSILTEFDNFAKKLR